jgi:hypothetical protein
MHTFYAIRRFTLYFGKGAWHFLGQRLLILNGVSGKPGAPFFYGRGRRGAAGLPGPVAWSILSEELCRMRLAILLSRQGFFNAAGQIGIKKVGVLRWKKNTDQ